MKIKEIRAKLELVNQIDISTNDKLTYGIKKLKDEIDDKLKPIMDKYNNEISEIDIDINPYLVDDKTREDLDLFLIDKLKGFLFK